MAKELESLRRKYQFVQRVEDAVVGAVPSVESITYDVFWNKEHDWYQEYVRVEYDGGAYAVRNCNGNSLAAIFKESGKLLEGGYYDEVKTYRAYIDSPDWEKVDLD